ncbi:Arc family DNA-binding protein [Acerihabitans sp. TG2]|uniref:Arc family DNA-binding protein n=1 Tax=Acerihabitans sp. TG2 TaxID=3096008 RepID=UPI002B23B2F9|nr:Arc family DNA-binding protein [Acerihabitans sp. TG2]MEA9390809.1 Arc family DNA-binding protein [Acerihabitans sp. TG2]
MSETANLTIKLPLELKERLRTIAANNSISMSAEISTRLAQSLDGGFDHSEESTKAQQNKEHVAASVDNQHTQEITEAPFTSSEVKKLRALLNASSKKKIKKK